MVSSALGVIVLIKLTYWKNMKKLIIIILILFLSSQLYAADSDRFIAKQKLPTGQMVVVAEGDFEARSIGSFSIRLYEPASAPDETTFFTSGLIHFRDGAIEKVMLNDVNGDQQPEIIVIARSVGTGNYLSAYVFTFTKDRLFFQTAVEGLSPNVNLIEILREKLERKK